MDFPGALVDDRALAVAEETPHWILVRVAVGAMDLNGVAGRTLRRDSREPLRQTRFTRVAASLVLQPARSQPEQARRLIVGLHLRDHLLDELMLADLYAKRLPILRVLHARIAARTHQAGRAGRDGESSLIEGEHRDLEALAGPADHIFFGNLHGVHREVARIAGEDAPLLFHRAAREPLESPLDDERTDAGRIALLLLCRIGPREHEEVIGDIRERNPAFLAAEDVPIAFPDGRRLNRTGVAAGARLGEAITRELFASCLRHEILLLLRLGAPGEQRQAVKSGVDRHDDAQRRVDVFELLARQT